MRGLEGKVAIITGAGGAIGRSISRRLAEERCAIAVLDKNPESADETVRMVRSVGGRAEAIVADITSHHAVHEGVARVEELLGPTDLLVNNAGWDRVGPFLQTTPDFWDVVIAINLTGPLNMHHVVLKRMQERKRGRVINIASDAGRVGSSGEAVYSACKGGIIAFTKTMARELATLGITLNAVCPGPTETPLLESFLGEGEAGKKVYEGLKRAIPMKRFGRPDDIPGLVAFLLSDDAAYITGQVISISGGLTMAG